MVYKSFTLLGSEIFTRLHLESKYVQYDLSLNSNVGNSGRPRTARFQANTDMVRRALEAHHLTETQFLTMNTKSSIKNCDLGCAPAIFA